MNKRLISSIAVIALFGLAQTVGAETSVTTQTETTTSGAIILPPASVEKHRTTEETITDNGMVQKQETVREEHSANGMTEKREIRKETTEY